MDDHTVTGRMLLVLDVIADSARPVRLAALTRGTGIPKPTVRRVAEGLVLRHLLERTTEGYRLGPKLVQLGARAARQHGLRDAAVPYVQDLYARTHEIVWASIFTEDSHALVDTAFGAHRATEMRLPWPAAIRSARFLTTAAARILLAHRPDLMASVRSRPLPSVTRYTVTDWRRVASAVESARDMGLAIENEQSRLGYNCVAAALLGRDERVVGAIGIIGRSGSFVAERHAQPVHAAATEISRIIAVDSIVAG